MKYHSAAVCCLGLLCSTAVFSHPRAKAQSPTRPMIILNVRVFDGVRVLPRASVLVRNGKIAAVGPHLAIPSGARVVNGAGKTLLPGLIDSHTHVFGPQSLKQALVFGVTTELDMFSDYHMDAAIRAQQASGKTPDMADLRSAGTLATAPGGHGTEYGFPIPTISRPEEAQAFVDARIAEGSDYIKIIEDDGSAYGIHIPTLSKATLAALVTAAHRRGKMAVVHIGTLQDARDAINAGADGLAHLFVDRAPDANFGRFVAAHHAFVIGTLTVLESVAGTASGASLSHDVHLAGLLSPSDIAALNTSFPHSANRRAVSLDFRNAEKAVRLLKAAHVPILAGTDAPNPGTLHGASIHRELELLVQAGLSPAEALASATSIPATRFHLTDRGRILPGMRADLLLVNGNPTRDILATRRIAAVWKRGVPLNRDSYRAAIRAQTRAATATRHATPPAGLKVGLISDFEDGTEKTAFGAGWAESTDVIAGGTSKASLKILAGGATGSRYSLGISGYVAPGLAYAWAGAMFYPGPAPMAPANLSGKKELSFWVKGDGKTYQVMIFSQGNALERAAQNFVASGEWKLVTMPLSDFKGIDPHAIVGIAVLGGPQPGPFGFQIDNVTLH